MKYVAVDGGLGNQMFQYAFLLALRHKGHKVQIIETNVNYEHEAGFELDRLFGIIIPPLYTCWTLLINKLPFPFRRIFSLTHKPFTDLNFRYVPDAINEAANYGFFYGTWQSSKYFDDIQNEVRNAFQFDSQHLSATTLNVKNMLLESNAVSVHIRRGDYLSATFKDGFGTCCPLDYYRRAIDHIKITVKNPLFIFFSDDMDWVRENLKVDNAIYVDHNLGLDSWQDMYLMTQCKHNIIANSTFSWWGAWLNENQNKIVIAPKRWWSTVEKDDVVPNNWIRL